MAKQLPRQSTAFAVALAMSFLHVLGSHCLFVLIPASMNNIHDRLIESLQPSSLNPRSLDTSQISAGRSTPTSRRKHLAQRLQLRTRRPQHERMVARIDRRRDQRRGLGIRARHQHQLGRHDVRLRAARHQPVDVLAHRHHHLAAHVPALLRAGRLVLDVDARRATLDEELGQLHRCRRAAVAGVGVGDDGAQVVDGRGALGGRCGEPLGALLAVVEELGFEEVVDFEGDGVLGA